jgi:hypothetical protein
MPDSVQERALAALKELATLPAAAGRSEAAGAPSESAGSTQAPGLPATVEGASTPTPVADDVPQDAPEVAIVRSVSAKQLDARLDALVVHGPAVRALAKEMGATIGVNEAGEPAIALPDGTEHPLTAESLRAAGIDDTLLKSLGKPGTGLTNTGAAPKPPTLEDGLRDQAVWSANNKLMLQLYAEHMKRGG